MKALFQALDFSQMIPGNSDISEENLENALEILLTHLSSKPNPVLEEFSSRVRLAGDKSEPDLVLLDTFNFQNTVDEVPRTETGGLDWAWLGPKGDKEWGWALNRHYFFRYLLDAYDRTGDPRYGERLDFLIQDWVVSNPPPEPYAPTPQWRALEAALRLSSAWCEVFYKFHPAPVFSDATKLLMLSSIPVHVDLIRTNHVPAGNILVMQLVAMLFAAAFFPEFRDASDWVTFVLPQLERETLEIQVYPDGVQKELTQHYHYVATINFDDALRVSKFLPRGVSPAFRDRVQLMWDYLARTRRPDGSSLLNNDSDLDDYRPILQTRVDEYAQLEWAWLISGGNEGHPPAGKVLSVAYPWAGHLISRDSWADDANWSFFDFGPYGTGHQHRDMLHLSVSAFGRQVLVDSGRYTYQRDVWRSFFFQATRAHNTVEVGRFGQREYTREAEAPASTQYLLTPQIDYAVGRYAGGYGFDWSEVTAFPGFDATWGPYLEAHDDILDPAAGGIALRGPVTHSRAVCFVKGRYWVILDQVDVGYPVEIAVHWHFHPQCIVHQDPDGSVFTDDATVGNLRLIPLGKVSWQVDLTRGQEDPFPQGWYSVEYGLKEPATCATYSGNLSGSTVFGWLLLPARGHPNKPVEALLNPQPPGRFQIRLAEDPSPAIIDMSVDPAHPACNVFQEKPNSP